MNVVRALKSIYKEMRGAGAFAHSGCGVQEDMGVVHSVGVLRHRHHAPALWLRSEV